MCRLPHAGRCVALALAPGLLGNDHAGAARRGRRTAHRHTRSSSSLRRRRRRWDRCFCPLGLGGDVLWRDGAEINSAGDGKADSLGLAVRAAYRHCDPKTRGTVRGRSCAGACSTTRRRHVRSRARRWHPPLDVRGDWHIDLALSAQGAGLTAPDTRARSSLSVPLSWARKDGQPSRCYEFQSNQRRLS